MTAPTGIRANQVSMGPEDCFVQGTLDIHHALRHVIEHIEECDLDYLMWGVSREVYPDKPMYVRDGLAGTPLYGEVNAACVDNFADWCHEMLNSASPGLFKRRFGGDVDGMKLERAAMRGAGVFRGVFFY